MLSDQKSEDWRFISGLNPTLAAAAGALFAAGVAEEAALIVAISPVPLFLAVWHMARHARLQLQMITYLEHYAPEGHASWERDLERARTAYFADRRRVAARLLRRKEPHEAPLWLARLLQPSAWNTWLAISAVVAVGANCVPLASGYGGACPAAVVGLVVLVASVLLVLREIHGIGTDRNLWSQIWVQQRDQSPRPDTENVEK